MSWRAAVRRAGSRLPATPGRPRRRRRATSTGRRFGDERDGAARRAAAAALAPARRPQLPFGRRVDRARPSEARLAGGPGGYLPAARAPGAVALPRAGPGGGRALRRRLPRRLQPQAAREPPGARGARALDGRRPAAGRGGALAGPRPGPRPPGGGRAGPLVPRRL